MNGIKPIRLAKRIKKNKVRKKGSILRPSFPMFGKTTSSGKKVTITSTKLPMPLGALFFEFIEAARLRTRNKMVDERNIIKRVLVIEKSSVILPIFTGGNCGSFSLPRK